MFQRISCEILLMNLFILILIWTLIIYNLTGIYLVIPLIIVIINIILSTFLLIFNPDSYFLRLVRVISIIYIGLIILSYLNILEYFIKWV